MYPKKIVVMLVLIMMLAAGVVEARFGSAPEGWPCVQPYVAKVSAGAFWTGGELPASEVLAGNETLMRLVEEVSDRTISYEQSLDKVKTFLDQLDGGSPEQKQEQVALLVVALTDIINSKRTQVLKGITRFGKRQQMMITRIEDQDSEIRAIESGDSPENASTLEDLKTRQTWDIRVFEDRELQKNYLCEQPVLLEQRFFLLGREIATWLKGN